ncbi:MAG: DUF397 domain-containing protein [Streptosporangiaceae bacterium]
MAGNGDCVEVAASGNGILVRDSKDPNGPTLAYSVQDWRRFLAATATKKVS